MATVTLEGISTCIGGKPILRDISLHVEDGEFIVLVGPSGAGKTALLRVIAGLDEVASGTIRIGGIDATDIRSEDRDTTLVFQESTLFPAQTARDNVGFPLVLRNTHRDEVDQRVLAEARALRIEHILERWPRELAAGHRQLVELARAMVRVPRVLLLDEPMSKLDGPTRDRLRSDLKELQRGYGVTTVYASNDWREALGLADRIVALRHGAVRQVGIPGDVYAAPADVEIAWLTGPISLVAATVEPGSSGYWLVGEGFRTRARTPSLEGLVGRRVTLGLRQESIVEDASSDIEVEVASPTFESGRPTRRVVIGGTTAAVAGIDASGEGDRMAVRLRSYPVFDVDGVFVARVE